MAFGLTSEITDFHDSFDHIFQEMTDQIYSLSPEAKLEKIEALFIGGLSMQARAYLLSEIFNPKQ